MTPVFLLVRVTLATLVVVVALSVGAAWLGGRAAGVGVLAGGGVAIVNLWALAAGARSMSAGAPRFRWSISTAIRFAGVAALGILFLANGVAHPVGFVVGLTVLPCALVVEGLRATIPAMRAE